ncbi:proline-rich basic protein 1-like [Falco naumanni]|uniref:proline-rich basic protein 1-like n=1 Tax=Falco naumanni TaxID=148594 RepID=UPI001ADE0F9A|nr:proline-rich basic protein 1-like [Falco naumanni]
MPRRKRDPILLSHAELPSMDGEGPRTGGDGRRSLSEEEGHLPGLPRDDLAKSMSGSSVSSYHSALCSEGTETFKDCLEFLEEEEMPPRAAAGHWAPAGPPTVPPPPGPSARPRQAQLSSAAKNSPVPGQGGRMGPRGGDRQPVTTPAPELGMLSGAPSDSDEVDGEVRALTARAFHSLSGLPGARLDMCSSHTSSSLSNSLSEDGGRPRRWPVAGSEPRGTVAALPGRAGWPFPASTDGELLGLLGKEQFECVDVELESGEARKGHGKKRTVPKRQILLKRKERKETGFGPRGDGSAPQPLPPARKEPPSKGRAVGEDFRLNYKQFVKTASLDADTSKTRAASCLVKNVLAKKMQYEQRIKMEQKGLWGSSTSSGLSSTGTDLLGDGLEGKSSSLSRSDCSFSAEDLRGGRVPAAAVALRDVTTTTHPTKGVVLSEATRDSVCKLKTTFNELNERMKYQEVLEGHWLPGTTEEPTSERIRYRRARALFEAHPGVGKVLDIAPRFEKAPKPWPSLKQRAILPSHPQALPFKGDSPALPTTPPHRLFTSQAQEVRLVPQSRQEEKLPVVPPQPPSPGPPAQGCPPAAPPKPDEKGKGKGRIPQPRDVRKLVKSSYNLRFGTAGASRGTTAPASTGNPLPATPLVIHCTSVCRREPATEPGDKEALAAASPEPAPPCADDPAKLTGSGPVPTQGSPVHITRVQATRRGATTTEGPPASPPRRERSELRVPPRAMVAEGVPHMETHLHVLVGRRSPVAAGEGSPAQSSAVLWAEKTVLFPPPPPSPKEGEEGCSHGGTGGLLTAKGLESTVQQHSSSDSGDPQAGPPASSAHPQPVKPAARSTPELPVSEQRQKQPGSQLVPTGSSSSAGDTGPTAPFQAREGTEGPPGRLPEQGEVWEHSPKWPAPTEPYLPAAPAENSNYLAIPVKAPKPSPMPKLPPVPSLASTSFGTPAVPSLANASFGTPTVPNPASTASGTPLVSKPASASFGTPMVPNVTNSSYGYPSASSLASTSFGTPLVSKPTNKSFGTSFIPYPASASFGTPLVPNLCGTSFGTPFVPNSANASFGSPLVHNLANSSLGTPLVPSPASSSFGSPLAPNPAPGSLGHPSVSNTVHSSLGSPLVPIPAIAPLGTGVCPLTGGEVPWSKPIPEPPLPQPPEGPAAAKRPVLLPPAQPQPRPEDAPQVLRRTDGTLPSSNTTPSPTRPFVPHLPAHRRMLVDPDSGKCYYMEPPRQPQLKTLYDPETGQYLEVLIPPVASHTGLYQAPFNPLVMAPGVYGPPYMPYSGFSGLPAPPPPSAPSPMHPDLPAADNPSSSGTVSSASKSEGPPAAGGPDCGYLESLYYIPTGMRASPGPPPAHASPEKGPLLQM